MEDEVWTVLEGPQDRVKKNPYPKSVATNQRAPSTRWGENNEFEKQNTAARQGSRRRLARAGQ